MEHDSVEPGPAVDPEPASAAPQAAPDAGPAPAGTDAAPAAPAGGAPSGRPGRLAPAIAVFTLLRLGLMAIITVVLMFWMPLIVALAFAVILQLPIAILLFPKQRRDLTAALAERRAGHHAERDRLRAQLMGRDDNAER